MEKRETLFFPPSGIRTAVELEKKFPEKFEEARKTGLKVVIEKWVTNQCPSFHPKCSGDEHVLYALPKVNPLTKSRVEEYSAHDDNYRFNN